MTITAKTSQLQIRISASQKELLQRLAAEAGLDMSTYVLNRALPPAAEAFQVHAEATGGPESSLAFAELNRFLAGLNVTALKDAVAHAPRVVLAPYLMNYLAATVEYVCAKRKVTLPEWTRRVAPLSEPVFGTTLKSLRLHLLANSPPPFRFRNIFIDSTVGDGV